MAAREEALVNTANTERSIATKLGYVAQKLESISFVRPARVSAEEKSDSAFTYAIPGDTEPYIWPHCAPIQ